MRLTHLLTILLLLGTQRVYGQMNSLQSIPLEDLSAFQAMESNWQIVGRVHSNRDVDHDIITQPGNGILVNAQTETERSHLFSVWDHADLELDLEVMIPKGSNSGIYFQSRYEIQLLDSWGVVIPRHSDIGGIYQRWDESRPEGEKGYEGHAPRINVARAPGLWQHLNILFKAPRFDAAGNKIENAKFERVILNGVVIHENVELYGPTRAAAYENEVASGSLMIQGDHGPVAFRNINYKKYNPESVIITDLNLQYYEGAFNHQMPDLESLNLVSSNEVDAISSKAATAERQFALKYNGVFDVPVSGEYTFEVTQTSRVRLYINGREVLTDQSPRVNGLREFTRNAETISLSKGEHSFELVYAKGLWHSAPTALGLFASGPGLMRTELTDEGSIPHDAYSAYEVAPDEEPWLQRNFVPHAGEKRTHAISVGYPSGIHYSYDMSRGALLHLWKGPFVDASTMWYQRGNMQSALPLGSVIERAGLPSISILDFDDDAWPDSLDNYTFQRYELNSKGEPTFFYKAGDLTVSDFLSPDESSRMLTRTMLVEGEDSNVWILLAESDAITEQQPGLFSIDDQRMYIEVDENMNVVIRDEGEVQQLILPLTLDGGSESIQYSFIW